MFAAIVSALTKMFYLVQFKLFFGIRKEHIIILREISFMYKPKEKRKEKGTRSRRAQRFDVNFFDQDVWLNLN